MGRAPTNTKYRTNNKRSHAFAEDLAGRCFFDPESLKFLNRLLIIVILAEMSALVDFLPGDILPIESIEPLQGRLEDLEDLPSSSKFNVGDFWCRLWVTREDRFKLSPIHDGRIETGLSDTFLKLNLPRMMELGM